MKICQQPNYQRIEMTWARVRGRGVNGHKTSIAKLPGRITLHREMHRIYGAMKRHANGMVLERPEPCEAKVSRTVLRGAWAG
jgi:hypothetical protein